MHGANAYWMPVALTSSAVAAPILFTSCLPCGAERDVVGEDGGAVDVVVSVHGVDAVDHRDAEPRRERPLLEVAHHAHPLRRRRLLPRHAPAAAKQAPDEVVLEDLRRRDLPLDLRHLADLLRERHPRQEVGDARLHRLGGVLVQHVLGLAVRRPGEQQHGGDHRRREHRHPLPAKER
ncbi:Os03g0749650, partial [Oryza sativa Japonica Group]